MYFCVFRVWELLSERTLLVMNFMYKLVSLYTYTYLFSIFCTRRENLCSNFSIFIFLDVAANVRLLWQFRLWGFLYYEILQCIYIYFYNGYFNYLNFNCKYEKNNIILYMKIIFYYLETIVKVDSIKMNLCYFCLIWKVKHKTFIWETFTIIHSNKRIVFFKFLTFTYPTSYTISFQLNKNLKNNSSKPKHPFNKSTFHEPKSTWPNFNESRYIFRPFYRTRIHFF